MSAAEIVPGQVVVDDRGRIAQLHGIGLQRFGDRWFAWGEDKAAGDRFTAVACYSTDDLATWRYEGDSLVAGTGELAALYIGDRWTENDLESSPLVTLPMRIAGDRVELEWRDRWTIDVLLSATPTEKETA